MGRAAYLVKADGAASQSSQKKIEISEDDLDLLKNKITQYHAVHRNFYCILLESAEQEKSKPDFFRKLEKMAGNMGITGLVNRGAAMILLPVEIDGELIAHRLSKCLNAEPVLTFETNNPEYAINRIKSMSQDE